MAIDYRARRADLKRQLDELDAEYRGKKFDSDTKQRWNEINSRIDTLTEQEQEARREASVRMERLRELAGNPRYSESSEPGQSWHDYDTGQRRYAADARGEALRSIDGDQYARDEAKELATKLIEPAVPTPAAPCTCGPSPTRRTCGPGGTT